MKPAALDQEAYKTWLALGVEGSYLMCPGVGEKRWTLYHHEIEGHMTVTEKTVIALQDERLIRSDPDVTLRWVLR